MSNFKPSYSGVGKMIRSDFMEAEMKARIEAAKARAIAIAPFDPKDKDGDHFNEHFSTSVTSHGGDKGDRACGTLTNDHIAAWQIEMGTSDTPAHATLRKALGL